MGKTIIVPAYGEFFNGDIENNPENWQMFRLAESDIVFPRSGYTLEKVIMEEKDKTEKIK